MKSNQVSVLVVLLLCLVMGGFLYVVDHSSDDEKGWNPSELYGELGARSYEGSSFSDVTFSGGASSDGVAVSMRNGSFSLRTRASRASSLTPNNPIASSPNNLPSLQGGAGGRLSSSGSLIGHMTSSAEFHSFGGGSNMAMGSYTSSSNNLIASSPAIGSYNPSPNSLITSLPNASGVGFNNLPSLQGGDGGRPVVSAEQALISASSSTSGLFGGMMTSYGTASYEDYYTSSPNRVNNRFNAPPGTSGEEGDDEGSAYLSWLEWLSKYGSAFGNQLGDENAWEFGDEESWNAFLAWYLATYNEQYDETGVVTPKITYDQWVSWFKTNGGSHYNDGFAFYFTPIGDIFPLLLMIFTYMVYVYLCRKGIAKFKQK